METVVETWTYLARAKNAGMTSDEMDEAVDVLSANPEAGDLIRGGGGIRKVRIAGRGKGKSGGYRVIHYWSGKDGRVFLLWVLSKGRAANLTDSQVNLLAKTVKELLR